MGLNIHDLTISSTAFDSEGRIPDRCAKDEENIQPELRIDGVPEGTVELAVVCHDPDAPMPFGFTHWTLYGIPPDTRVIPENGDGAFRPGPNDYGDLGYGGPQPPSGHGPHHYYFWVYALDRGVEGAPSRKAFLETYGDHVLEQNRVVGIYESP
jgi:Raf kinase inhibitor-like YbhB/YbcL family protein